MNRGAPNREDHNTMTKAKPMVRALDICLALAGLLATAPLVLILMIWIKASSPGPALFVQTRVGRGEKHFLCYKLRTMKAGTPSVGSHEMGRSAITPAGHILRRTKLDELPQLWNVLTGEMSLVGPRPCLPNQSALIEARRARAVFDMRPGITGLAQVRGVDMSEPVRLAELDSAWLSQESVGNYLRLILQTIAGSGRGDRVSLNA